MTTLRSTLYRLARALNEANPRMEGRTTMSGEWQRRHWQEQTRVFAPEVDHDVVEQATWQMLDGLAVLAEQAGLGEAELKERVRGSNPYHAVGLALGWALEAWDEPETEAPEGGAAEDFGDAGVTFRAVLVGLAVEMRKVLAGWRDLA